MNSIHVAAVVLNYNTEKDLQVCAELLSKQVGVTLSIILVDNASRPSSLAAIKLWLADWCSEAVCGSTADVSSWVRRHPDLASESGRVYLIENHENLGYSAGNNIGLCLADKLQADVALIVNPDMRIEAPSYLHALALQLLAEPQNIIAASRILNLDGTEQHIMRDINFWEELFWLQWILPRVFNFKSYSLICPVDRPSVVHRVSGCCFLIRMDFLRLTNYLDENVFLYCEEPILSAKVRAVGGKIIHVPSISAIHAHVSSEKSNKVKRTLLFIKSRRYYLKTYSGFNRLQLLLLSFSYFIFSVFQRIKGIGK